jgi:hypothetical protein
MKKVKNLQNNGSIRFLDQAVSATNNYLLIIPSLVNHDFQAVAKMSLFLSIFTFWLALARISIINEVLDHRNLKTSYLVFSKKMFIIAIPIPFFYPVYQLFGLNNETIVYLILITIFALQEELSRQYFLSIKKFLYALQIDLTWFLSSSIIMLIVENDIENSIKAWLYGCTFSLVTAFFLLLKDHENSKNQKINSKIDHISLGIPIILTVFTLSQNVLFDINRNGVFLGHLRSIQLFYLPAIFLINVQQSLFVPLISSKNIDKVKLARRKLTVFAIFLILFGAITSVLYFGLERMTTHLSIITILVALSVMLNFEITYISLILVVNKKIKYLTKIRLTWIAFSIFVMLIFLKTPIFSLILLTLIDLIFLYFISNKRKLIESGNSN